MRRSYLLFAIVLTPVSSIPFNDIAERNDSVNPQWSWINFDGCDGSQQTAIGNAWDDAVLKLAGGVTEINFDEVPAVEFFGPSALNHDYQWSILSVFTNIATFQRSILPGWRSNAFCGIQNDHRVARICFQYDRNGVPIKNPDGSVKETTVVAYQWNTKNNDGTGPPQDDQNAYSNTMFCPSFFRAPRLDDVVNAWKKDTSFINRYNIDNYNLNTGSSKSSASASQKIL
jgi:hypothetical protein